MERKFELTEEKIYVAGRELHRIRALKDFSEIKQGYLGGFVENESNLSHDGDCWIHDDAKVFGCARVYENANVFGCARVYDNANVFGCAELYENVEVFGCARVYDNANVFGCARVYDNANVFGCTRVYENAEVFGYARVYDDSGVSGHARVYENAEIFGCAEVYLYAEISENAYVELTDDYVCVNGFGCVESMTFFKCSDNSIRVHCGDSSSTLEEFEENVKEKYKTKQLNEYLSIINIINIHFE